ncbi:YqaA family protein [Helicobacter sp.]|uniref:YqaA family protein n=1 Tax=Helicobacter sp. TaxID=218 RepID=UPI0025BD54AF|nr:VTT domain-containing protein [Helicobacter sp.]MCI5969322.1 VTT domain-containing protein [Helicobacter sp.]MDY2585576.1 VTT domain-containing protein [Helicobacter sp.]
MDFLGTLGLLGLFLVCFLASSLYPLGSEVFVLGFLALDYAWVLVWIVATLGNTLGALTTYGIGYLGDSYCLRHFKQMHAKVYRYKSGIQNYGFLYAFFTFLPILGDIFALALGVYRYSFVKAFVFIALGKGVRYLVLIAFFSYR